MNNKRLSKQDWSVFWNKGTLTTFHGIFEENYSGSIANFWQQISAELSTSDSVLDLATGNGALPSLIAKFTKDRKVSISIDAIDFADIKPNERDHANINYHPNVNMEDLPFASDSYELATSQFGFEYGNHEKILAELDRVLKPQAKIALLVHSTESAVLLEANESLQQIRLCDSSELITITRKLAHRIADLRTRGKAPQKDRKCEKLRNQFNDEIAVIDKSRHEFKQPGHIDFYLNAIVEIIKAGSGRATINKALRYIINESTAAQHRYNDLLAAALTPNELKELSTLIAERGFSSQQINPIYFKDELFGTTIVAKR